MLCALVMGALFNLGVARPVCASPESPTSAEFLFDAPPTLPEREFKAVPDTNIHYYQDSATLKILQSCESAKGGNRFRADDFNRDDFIVLIRLERSGALLSINIVKGNDNCTIHRKALRALITAIRTTKFEPLPEGYPARELTFKFDPSELHRGSVSVPAAGDTSIMVATASDSKPAISNAPSLPLEPTQRWRVQSDTGANHDDQNPRMKLAWQTWRSLVADGASARFNSLAKGAFRSSAPLNGQIRFVVTRFGHIYALEMTRKSPNALFNVFIFQTIKSLEGDVALLQFPPASSRSIEQRIILEFNVPEDGGAIKAHVVDPR